MTMTMTFLARAIAFAALVAMVAGNEIECTANGDESCSADQTTLLQAKVDIAAKTLTGDGDGTQLATKSFEVGAQCKATCWGQTCDYWAQAGTACGELTGDRWGCDCSGCSSCRTCKATCYGKTCDQWVQLGSSCDALTGTDWGCDCSGCPSCTQKPAPTPPPPPPSPPPPPPPTQQPTKCRDSPGAKSGKAWTDGEDGCASYGANAYCPEYGGKDYGEGKANDKCCVCGGGIRGTTNTEQWVIHSDSSGSFVQNIPEDASQKIASLANSGSKITSVSFTRGGGWTVLWGRNSFTCRKAPDAACRALGTLARQGRTLKSITYTVDDGWVILYDRNRAWINNIPNEAAKKLKSLGRFRVQITGVSFTTGGGWTVLWDTNSFACRGVPNEAARKLGDLQSQGKTLKSIAYTSNDGWVILYDRSGYDSLNIPADAHQKLESLRTSGADITSVSFPPQLPVSVDRSWVIKLMKKYGVRGLSLAVVKDGEIYAQGYGVTQDGGLIVDTKTHFQAGSISKPLSALGALRLVHQGQLDLNEDVNTRLKSWKYRQNRFTPRNGINLRQILSHTGGFVWSGSPGYAVGSPVPSLLQILNGDYPANTRPIAVAYPTNPPEYHYGGGGYMVMQQEIEDVTGSPFADFMSSTVLGPLGMASSSYEAPAPSTILDGAAAGYEKGKLINGKWMVYPEKAAASLWSTPSDLVKFVIHMHKAAKGQGIIPANLRKQMLTIQPGTKTFGLGLEVAGQGASRYYYHGASTNGYLAHMKGFTETGDGAVVMINANRNGEGPILYDVLRQIGKNFGWP